MSTRKEMMEQIAVKVSVCKRCRLHETATHGVPGEGNIESPVVFIGEAPGEKEDLSGRPFVGRAGQLLETMLKKIGKERSDVWIGNIIKHRPPENRDPLPDELTACQPYLTWQLKIMAPKLVVTLGRFSMNYFAPNAKISRDRGTVIKVGGYNVYPVYHPAAALRNPEMMRDFMADFVRIPEVLKKIMEEDSKKSNTPPQDIATEDGQLGLGV